jgi:hypothetical protein
MGCLPEPALAETARASSRTAQTASTLARRERHLTLDGMIRANATSRIATTGGRACTRSATATTTILSGRKIGECESPQ